MAEEYRVIRYAWFLDVTPNGMFSLYEYPIAGKDGLPLCEEHGKQLELKEVVLYDKDAAELAPPDHYWVYEGGTKAGDWLQVEIENGTIISAVIDQEETARAKQRIAEKLDRLRRGEHLDNAQT
jgi:hypothetical protein